MKNYRYSALLATFLTIQPAFCRVNKQVVCAEPITASVILYQGAIFLLGYVASKALDPLWESQFGGPDGRHEVLNNHLADCEEALRAIDAKQADAIAEFRQSLSEKTSPDDVRRILQPSIDYLESRVQQLERQVTTLDYQVNGLEGAVSDLRNDFSSMKSRVEGIDNLLTQQGSDIKGHENRLTRIERIFGQVGYVPPAPMLTIRHTNAAPQPIDLVRDWFQLLERSESSRFKLLSADSRLGRRNPELLKYRQDDRNILAEISDFYIKVNKAYIAKASEREHLKGLYDEGSSQMFEFDKSFATYGWLLAVNQPVSTEFGYRLGVPGTFFSEHGSEILKSLKQAGVDEERYLAPFYTRQFSQAYFDRMNNGNIRSSAGISDDILPLYFLTKGELEKFGFDGRAIDARNGLVRECYLLARRASYVSEAIASELVLVTGDHPRVKQLEQQKKQLTQRSIELHQLCNQWINFAVKQYLEFMVSHRPTITEMVIYRDSILIDLSELKYITACEDTSDENFLDLTFRTLSSFSHREFREDDKGPRAILIDKRLGKPNVLEVKIVANARENYRSDLFRLIDASGVDVGAAKILARDGETLALGLQGQDSTSVMFDLKVGSVMWLVEN